MGFEGHPRRPRPPGHGSSGRRETLRRVHVPVRHAGRRVRVHRQRHAGQHDRQHDQPDPGVRERPWRHGTHSHVEPHRPSRLARARHDEDPQDALRVQRDQPLQPEDGDARLQLAQQGRGPGARRRRHRPQRYGLVEGLRLQRPDSRFAERQELLRSPVRPAGPLQRRHPGTGQREVPVLGTSPCSSKKGSLAAPLFICACFFYSNA